MRGRVLGGVAAAAVLAVWVLAAATGDPNALDAHGFMDSEDRCGGCHHMEPDGADWLLDPHLFVRPVVPMCMECHPSDRIGRSHPVGVDPYAALDLRDLPEDLPLHWSDDARAEVMTCGTCHDPHRPRFSDVKLFSFQQPHPGAGGQYLTFFLRVRGESPREGFTPLCHRCHPGL